MRARFAAALVLLAVGSTAISAALTTRSRTAYAQTQPSPTATAAPGIAAPAAAPPGRITGVVFRDLDADGSRDLTPAVEPGLAGVRVVAYDANENAVAETRTAPGGGYALDVAVPARVEVPEVPAGLVRGPRDLAANGGASDVRFTDGSGEANWNFSMVRPGDTCQTDPELAVACFVTGPSIVNGGNQVIHTVAKVPPNGNGLTPPAKTIAQHGQTGAVYGIAWQPSSGSVFSSAYVKRFTGLGPAGIAGIYRNERPWLNLATVPGFAGNGTDPHPKPNGDWKHDPGSFALVMKTGFGDLDISLDGTTLYVVNLFTRQLVTIPIRRDGSIATEANRPLAAAPIGEVPGAGRVGQFNIPDVCSGFEPPLGVEHKTDGSSWRPFGLGVEPYPSTAVLVGGTCTVERRAAILRFDPAAAKWDEKPLLDFDVSFARGHKGFEAAWDDWVDVETKLWNKVQLVVSDIVFDGDDMVIGLRDRYGDQTGREAHTTDPASDVRYTSSALGEILRACRNTTGAYQLEQNSRCGGRETKGKDNQDGPGGGEFYWQDDLNANGRIGEDNPHANSGQGALAVIASRGQVVNTQIDPTTYHTSGLLWYDAAGARAQTYELVSADVTWGLGKANGLGDLTALCDEGPIEIGDRVWYDPNKDGIQGADEAGIGGVAVDLLDPSGRAIAQAKTDRDGAYVFSNAKGASTDSVRKGIAALQSYTAGYRIRIALDQTVLRGLQPTAVHAQSGEHGNPRDSDGTPVVGAVETNVTTGIVGQSDPTFDFGFFGDLLLSAPMVDSAEEVPMDTLAFTG